MATYINVISGGDDLLARVKGQQEAGRLAFLEEQRRKELDNELKKNALDDKEDQGRSLPPQPYKRELAAHRHVGDLAPLAITWRGQFAPTQPQVVETYNLGQSIYPNDGPWIFTYRGTGTLTPSPIRVASPVSLSSVSQATRSAIGSTLIHSDYNTVEIDTNYTNYFCEQVQFGSSSNDPWVSVATAPTLSSLIGPTSYTPSNVSTAIDADGVVFITFALPKDPRSYTSMTYNNWVNANYPVDTLITDDRRQKTVLVGYSPWYIQGLTYYSPDADIPTPYLFVRIENGTVTQNKATRAVGQAFDAFYSANCFSDDPSAGVRGSYDGYYHIRNQRATILRLNEEGTYSDYPFGGLTQFTADADGVPVIPSTASFELHHYNLPSWTTDAELATLLNACDPPGGSGTTPSTTQKVRCQPSLFTQARDQMGSDTGDVLTDNHYFMYPL